MDFLDSRHLTTHDGYIHPFRDAGTFNYSALISELSETPEAGLIVVEAGGGSEGEGQQHDIVLHWDAAAGRFLPRDEDRRKTIKQNDFVVFQFDAAVPGQPPCFVLIQHELRTVGDSRKLQKHDAYTHFFLQAGDYAYSVGRASYRLSVTDHRKFSAEEQTKRAQEPLVVMVNGSDLSVKHAKIVAGQTVIWAVESGSDVSIVVTTGGDKKSIADAN